jgi:hypothetical protein
LKFLEERILAPRFPVEELESPASFVYELEESEKGLDEALFGSLGHFPQFLMDFIFATQHFLPIEHDFLLKELTILIDTVQHLIPVLLELFPFFHHRLKLIAANCVLLESEVIHWFFGFLFEQNKLFLQVFLN